MINYGKHFVDKEDLDAVNFTLKYNFLTQGDQVKKFEKNIKNFFGGKYCLAVNSGTSALHLALKSLSLKKNSLVLTTPITFIATANSVLYNNHKLDLIDIDLKNYCLDLNLLEKYLIQKKNLVKAVIFVDYAGNTLDWDKIFFLKKKYNFFTINDNCHALGAKYKNDIKYAVKYADLVTHSYHPVKLITTGEGGSILTDNKFFYDKIFSLRSHGIIRNPLLEKKFGRWFYEVNKLGYNYRLSDIASSLGNSQIKKAKKFLKKRREIAKIYDYNFKGIEGIIIPQKNESVNHAYHLYVLLIDFNYFKISKKNFFQKLLKKSINLQVHYVPIYNHKLYQSRFKFNKKKYPQSEKFFNQAVSLPVFYELKLNQQKYVINEIKKILKINEHKKKN